MADITFRLPGREQYSYAEVTVTSEEYYAEGPDSVSDLLLKALTDLNAAFPQSDARPTQQAPQAAPQAAPAANGPTCAHGPRKWAKGTSARGEWQGMFCSQPKGAPDQCSAIWLKNGQPGWVY